MSPVFDPDLEPAPSAQGPENRGHRSSGRETEIDPPTLVFAPHDLDESCLDIECGKCWEFAYQHSWSDHSKWMIFNLGLLVIHGIDTTARSGGSHG